MFLEEDGEDFAKSYKEIRKKITDSTEFKSAVIELILEHIDSTEFSEHKEFVQEIKYFLYYILLVIDDDYEYGDKVFQHSVMHFDNYIFSHYRKVKELEENINRLIALSNSKRFAPMPKENLIQYFVFLEENKIEIMDILRDYVDLITPKKNIFLQFIDILFKRNKKIPPPVFIE